MGDIQAVDIEYRHGPTRMIGSYCVAADAASVPGVLMVHGGFGLVPQIVDNARWLAGLGYAVLAVDLWGDRLLPAGPGEFSKLIAALARDRAEWLGRLDAARTALGAQPAVRPGPVAAVGYCFGGSSVLEYARAGRDVAAAISLHGGLDTVALDWSACAPDTSVLILTGADDPMAPATDLAALHAAMTAAGVDWETDVFSATDHAYTFADSPNYNARSDRRSWLALRRLLAETFAGATR